MAKLLKSHYIEIIERTIAGESRASISKDMPVDKRYICKILCSIVDGTLSDYVSDLLADVLTDEVVENVRKTTRVGRSIKQDFIEYVENTARDELEHDRMMKGWQEGWAAGYNNGRAKRDG